MSGIRLAGTGRLLRQVYRAGNAAPGDDGAEASFGIPHLVPTRGTSTPEGNSAAESPPGGTSSGANALDRSFLLALLLLTLLLYAPGLTRSVGEFTDASHHLLNGIFVLDALREPGAASADPWSYAMRYYLHYPGVNVGYYPPFFPLVESGVMALLGVSGPSGQVTVLLFALLLCIASFHWLRLRLEPAWAAGATALLLANPLLVYWGRDIMIDVPVLAMAVAAMWVFERQVGKDRPSWRGCLALAAVTSGAIWTKQHALLLLPVYAVATLTLGRWDHVRRLPVLFSAALIGAAATGLILLQLKLGGDAVGHSVGFTAQHVADRFNWGQWIWYPWRLPGLLGWPVLIMAMVGLTMGLLRRVPRLSPLVVWIVVFYLMHSYMRAQDPRYALLWLPPFFALAGLGLQQLATHRRDNAGRRLRPTFAVVLLVVMLGWQLRQASRVEVPRVSSAYLRAAYDLRDRLDGFTCLVFTPERQSRMPALFRIAVEERRESAEDVYRFGRLLRAEQVLRGWPDGWAGIDALIADLADWNVKYILLETPSPVDERSGQHLVREAVDGVVEAGAYRPVAAWPVQVDIERWPVRLPVDHPQRELVLLESVSPMTLNPDASPPIRPKRVPIEISEQQLKD